MEQETAEQLSAELKRTISALDAALDRMATAATQVTAGITSIADLAGRISRMVHDPPAEQHVLEIHDGGHEATDSNPPADPTDPAAN